MSAETIYSESVTERRKRRTEELYDVLGALLEDDPRVPDPVTGRPKGPGRTTEDIQRFCARYFGTEMSRGSIAGRLTFGPHSLVARGWVRRLTTGPGAKYELTDEGLKALGQRGEDEIEGRV